MSLQGWETRDLMATGNVDDVRRSTQCVSGTGSIPKAETESKWPRAVSDLVLATLASFREARVAS